MKHFLTSWMSAALLAASATAFAAGPISVSPQQGSTVFAPPAWTTLKIEVPWTDPDVVASISRDNASLAPTLSFGGSSIATVDVSDTGAIYVGGINHGYEVYIKFPGQSEVGEYTVTVPKGLISYDEGSSSSSKLTLDEVSVSFKIADSRALVVSPAGGSDVMASNLSEVTLSYALADRVLVGPAGTKCYLTETTNNTSLTTYTTSVKGTTVYLTADNPSAIEAAASSNSSGGGVALHIPAETFISDGVANEELTYSYKVRPILPSAISTIPACGNSEPYTIGQLASMQLKSSIPIAKVGTSVAAVKLEQWNGSAWVNPTAYNKATYLTLTQVDDYTVQLSPRPQASTYTVDIYSISSGTYRLNLAGSSLYVTCNGKDLGNLANFIVGNFEIAGATEAYITTTSPANDDKVFDGPLTAFHFSFPSAMAIGSGAAKIYKGPELIQSVEASEIQLSADNKTATLPLQSIENGDADQEYTIVVPAGLLHQEGGDMLPSEAKTITFTMAKMMKNLGVWTGRSKVTPEEGYFTSLQDFTVKYYGASSVVPVNTAEVKIMRGSTQFGGAASFSSPEDNASAIEIHFANSVATANITPYVLDLPEGAFRIYTEQGFFSSPAAKYYFAKFPANTTVQAASSSSSGTVPVGLTPISTITTLDSAAEDISKIKLELTTTNTGHKLTGAGPAYLIPLSAPMTASNAVATFTGALASNGQSASFSSSDLSAVTPGTYALYLPKANIKGYKSVIGAAKTAAADLAAVVCISDENAAEATVTINPADGISVPAFSAFQVLPGEGYHTVSFAPGSVAVSGPQESEEGFMVKVTSKTDSRLDMNILPVITTPGDYTLSFPTGKFLCDGERTKSFEYHFTVISAPQIEPMLWSSQLATSVTDDEGNTVTTEPGAKENPTSRISSIAFTFDEGAELSVKTGAVAKVGVVEGTGQNELIEWSADYHTSFSAKGNQAWLYVTPAVTSNGMYYIKIPAGVIKVNGFDCPGYEGYIMVQDPAAAVFTPASGTTLQKLETVTVTFPNADKVEASQKALPYVENESGEATKAAGVEVKANVMTVTFSPALTAKGTYRFVLPAEAALCSLADDTPVANAMEQAEFILNNPCEMAHSFNIGSLQLELKEFDITFPQAEKVELDDTKAITAVFTPTENTSVSADPSKAPAKAPAQHSATVAMTSDTSAHVTLTPGVDAGSLGTLSMTYPAGMFVADNFLSPEHTVAVNFDPIVNVSELEKEYDGFDVVDLSGNVLLMNAGRDALHQLEPGIYIINGKATLLK